MQFRSFSFCLFSRSPAYQFSRSPVQGLASSQIIVNASFAPFPSDNVFSPAQKEVASKSTAEAATAVVDTALDAPALEKTAVDAPALEKTTSETTALEKTALDAPVQPEINVERKVQIRLHDLKFNPKRIGNFKGRYIIINKKF
jgi:hypothetical protein